MHTVFLAGGIASGKSSVARRLFELGAARIDLDELSRAVLSPGHDCLAAVAEAFGSDILDAATGELRRDVLAQRAFADADAAKLLESVEHPFIIDEMRRRVASCDGGIVVIEVPLLDRVEAMFDEVDEILACICPIDLRRERAIARGMSGEDFDARCAMQPSDEYLIAHADTVFDNSGSYRELIDQVDLWWESRARERMRG